MTGRDNAISVHLTSFPTANESFIDKKLEERMEMAQLVASMVLSLRKKANIRVRQPLSKIMIPVMSDEQKEQLEKVEGLILSEVNVKKAEYLTGELNILVKKVRPNFASLKTRYSRLIGPLTKFFNAMTQEDIRKFEQNNGTTTIIDGQEVNLILEDALITTEDIPGWTVTTQDNVTVALDITITPDLFEEGLAREIINRVQNMRKEKGLEVTDKIILTIEKNADILKSVERFGEYICSETLATLQLVDAAGDAAETQELVDNIFAKIAIQKL